MSEADPRVGQIVDGAFRIERLLGQGGMGQVYLAHQLAMDRPVVLKILLRQLADDATALERFQREARFISRLNHPNVVSVHTFGRMDDGALFLVMEYVHGLSLREELKASGALPQDRALRIVDQILSALTEAHSSGLIHRDLKPENVMLTQKSGTDDLIKVLDFGIAKVVAEDQPALTTLTATDAIIGTPRYMSPEQARSKPLDARSDLYSLGLILHEMVAGAHPFKADTPLDFLLKHVTEPVPSLIGRYPERGIHAAVERIVLCALEKQPERRFRSAADMQRAVRGALALLQSGDVPTPRLPADEAFPAAPIRATTLPERSTETAPGGSRRKRVLLGLAGLAGVVAVATVLALVTGPVNENGGTPRDPSSGKDDVASPIPTSLTLHGESVVIGPEGNVRVGRPPAPETPEAEAVEVDGLTLTWRAPEFLTVTSPFDHTNVDVGQFFGTARKLARLLVEDAELWSFTGDAIAPDGTANLTLPGDPDLYFSFRSPSRSTPDPAVPVGVEQNLRCFVTVSVGDDDVSVVAGPNKSCRQPLVGQPRCTPSEVWQRAIAAGEPATGAVTTMYFDGSVDGRPSWLIRGREDRTHRFPDDCGAQ